jgi:hypothetical protein
VLVDRRWNILWRGAGAEDLAVVFTTGFVAAGAAGAGLVAANAAVAAVRERARRAVERVLVFISLSPFKVCRNPRGSSCRSYVTALNL